jgi:two-component system, response regulator PdtaR
MAMPAQMEREDLAGARVLVVEDEFVIALEVEFLLRDFGCEVLGPVPSVARALELLGRERPDAAPLDLDLLGGTAVPVAELLASMRVPFALVTAYDPTPIEAPALRGMPHLGKPVGHDTLRRMLAALLTCREQPIGGTLAGNCAWRGCLGFVPGGSDDLRWATTPDGRQLFR